MPSTRVTVNKTRAKLIWQKATLLFCHIRGAFATPNFGQGEIIGISDDTIRKIDGGFL